MKLYPFSKNDWQAFSGAEKGPLDQTPAIAYGRGLRNPSEAFCDAATIVSGSGVEVYLDDETGQDIWHLNVTFAAGLIIAKALIEPIEPIQLKALGFQRI
jgi:hypothetical protein